MPPEENQALLLPNIIIALVHFVSTKRGSPLLYRKSNPGCALWVDLKGFSRSLQIKSQISSQLTKTSSATR